MRGAGPGGGAVGRRGRAPLAAVDVRPARPQHVWLIRDHLEALAERAQAALVPYTVLTGWARFAAALWFPLRKAPGRK